MNEILNQYKEELVDDFAASADMRDMSNEEYRFVMVAGGQWEGWLENPYENRAKMQLNHVAAFVRRHHSAYLQNRPAVNYSPSDEATSDADADLLDGLIRRDLQRKGGQASIDTAVWEQKCCGYGVVLLKTEYEDEGDPQNNNQNIVFEEQPCAYSTVVFDAAARRADKSDAMRCNVMTPYAKKVFEQKWPDADVTPLNVFDRGHFNYGAGKPDIIWVSTRYEVVEDKQQYYLFVSEELQETVLLSREEIERDQRDLDSLGFVPVIDPNTEQQRKRPLTKRIIKRCVFAGGDEFLEPSTRIAGKHIPAVPFYGYRAFVDGQEHYNGIVREHMDAQRGANMAFSLAMETAAHSTSSKMILAPEQIENASIAAQFGANFHQAAYAVIDDRKDGNNNPIVSPVQILEGSSMSPVAGQVLQIATQSLEVGLGGTPQETLDPNSSGKAIQAMFDRNDANTNIVHDNTDMSMRRIGEVYASMAAEVYTAVENRSIKILTDRNEAQSTKLMEVSHMKGERRASNDLSKGSFDVVVNIGRNYEGEREEAFEALKDVAMLFPEGTPERSDIGKALFTMKEGRGLDAIQDSFRKELLLSGRFQPESDEEKQWLAEQQQAAQNQEGTANDEYLRAEAAKATSQAQLNEAKTGETMASAVLKAKQAINTDMKTAQIAQEVRQPVEQ